MLNTAALSRFLTANAHPQLFARIMVLTSSGRVVAYSTPAAGSQVRDQATLISMLWSDNNDEDMYSSRQSRGTKSSKDGSLQSLIIEYGEYNIVAQKVDANLILVLMSCAIPGCKNRELAVTAERDDEEDSLPDDDLGQSETMPMNLQKKKARAMARHIGQQTSQFKLPDED